jgi:hypothetical protein
MAWIRKRLLYVAERNVYVWIYPVGERLLIRKYFYFYARNASDYCHMAI